MIGIRADANGIIASGHVMRCIAIAEQIEKSGESVIFITADHFPDDLLNQKGFNHICLESDWQDKTLELVAMNTVIEKYGLTTLLIDSYQVTKEYLEKLHTHVNVAYIDDLYKFIYPVDMIINYAIDADISGYEGYNGSTMQWLIGPKYIPLRKEFQNILSQQNPEVKNVLITTGGSDNYHIILWIVKRIIRMNIWNNVCFHIIVGVYFSFEEITALDDLCIPKENIILHKNLKNMAEIMVKCDIAVSAGGTTLAELCACGIPSICFAIADNQLDGIRSYGKSGIMACVGDIRQNLDEGIDAIFVQMERLKNSYEIRKQYSKEGSKLIDGSGARRIADRLLQLDRI